MKTFNYSHYFLEQLDLFEKYNNNLSLQTRSLMEDLFSNKNFLHISSIPIDNVHLNPEIIHTFKYNDGNLATDAAALTLYEIITMKKQWQLRYYQHLFRFRIFHNLEFYNIDKNELVLLEQIMYNLDLLKIVKEFLNYFNLSCEINNQFLFTFDTKLVKMKMEKHTNFICVIIPLLTAFITSNNSFDKYSHPLNTKRFYYLYHFKHLNLTL